MGFFDRLKKGLSKSRGNLTERVDELVENTAVVDDDFYEELTDILLLSDVGVRASTEIIDELRRRVEEKKVKDARTARQMFKDLLVEEMNIPRPALHWPMVMFVVGVNGVGKTTTVGKLALRFQEIGRSVILAAADTFRAAADDQLSVWAERAHVPLIKHQMGSDPAAVVFDAVQAAKARKADLLIIDTAGRLHIDQELMDELVRIKENVHPQEILLVVDAMTGQDAVNVAQTFNEKLDIDGVILTKLDGDTRGGAALSVRAVTGKPIKFSGTGEKLSEIEPFHPDRMASRILGMGDVLTLIDKASEAFDQEDAEKLAKKARTADLTLDDFLDQMQSMKKMGGIKSMLEMLPGMSGKDIDVDENAMKKPEAIIRSMTPKERRNPGVLNASRRKRIAAGSGTTVQDVNQLIRQFDQAKQMMKQVTQMKGKGRMRMRFPGMR